MQVAQAVVAAGRGQDRQPRALVSALVDDDQLEVGTILLKHTAHRRADHVRATAGADDHRNRFHQVAAHPAANLITATTRGNGKGRGVQDIRPAIF